MLPEIKLKNEFLRSLFHIALLVILLSLSFACGGNPSLQKKSNANASPEVKLTEVERDIKKMQTANFHYIFVFRRKDGGVFDSEDIAYLTNNSPAQTNRRYLSDEEKAIVIGSSFKFEPEMLKKLSERFTIEDFSSPTSDENTNVNQTNDNKNINK